VIVNLNPEAIKKEEALYPVTAPMIFAAIALLALAVALLAC